ncbi:hypothetical protein EAF00_001346 [Botryotinia globosa]|nr:hypothetical protein EAF00_001346 [Botryotinia globosa]
MCVDYLLYVEAGIDKIASVRISNLKSLSRWLSLSRGPSTDTVQSKAAMKDYIAYADVMLHPYLEQRARYQFNESPIS